MKKVILTKGLPASGKSTWAKQLIDENPGMYKRINKDDLRLMLDNSKWSKDNEKFIIQIRNLLILHTLADGKHVIVDDTNLHPKHETTIRQLVKGLAEVEIKDFTDVPLDECIKRDKSRTNSVGEKVIRQMHKQFLWKEPEKTEYNDKLFDAIICDLDGTLALFGDKNPYERDFINDTLNENVADILRVYNNNSLYTKTIPLQIKIILVSGRDGKYQDETEKWLFKNNIPYNKLFMRLGGDRRKDVIVKKEIYDNHIKNKYNVLFVLDDRNQVVNMWREQGLTCLQVAEGNF